MLFKVEFKTKCSKKKISLSIKMHRTIYEISKVKPLFSEESLHYLVYLKFNENPSPSQKMVY